MGGTSWSDDHYRQRSAHRAATGKAAFEYDASIRTGKAAAKIHDNLDPSKMKAGVREARDSEEHPESNAVFVGFDVTGSMLHIPQVVQKKLCTLMGLLLRKSYLTDPAICVAGIGDANTDRAPLQIGQFESGIEVENDLTNLWLEGMGGGQMSETYELALYFLARKTACDCFEKRQKKGYAFIIGDELAYPAVKRGQVQRIFGDGLEADIPIKDILAEATAKWEVYYILPKMTSHYDDPRVIGFWRDLLGERAIKIDDAEAISELIATLIGSAEGAVDVDSVVTDLTGAGVDASTADSVSRSLATVGSGGGIAPLSKGTGLSEL